jgi:hypothetical protein
MLELPLFLCEHSPAHLQIPAVMAATSPISVAINVMGAYNLWWSQKVAYEGGQAL